ncbi:MAG: nucleotide sugar dehydrogenase [Candidatus Neomarinimicrobiota bacterium]|jgi:UDP-N-acetyl-D-glucosamine dehydrogenase|nr:nucleotide sugar dehydrogenase [Candidatus Neomarinimicrobiota bacterium]MDX9780931.1 nucleotide sugar dehydrogenase [bacterium]
MRFLDKLKTKDIQFGIIGLGYVGLPLAVEVAKVGISVTGIEIDKEKVRRINEGINYIGDIKDDDLKHVVEKGLLHATLDFSVIQDMDVISICVPTPLNKLKDPDMSFITSALEEIVKHIHKNLVIILESTTYPGTTREYMLPKLEESGLKCGKDFYLAFSPERVDPGNPQYHTKNTPKVLGGVTDICTEHANAVYTQIFDSIVPVSSAEAAEMAKLLENTFRMINIGLVNELAIMCDRLGVDVWEVIDAAATKPFGFMKFYPGPGLGGHCIPIDPHYLSWKMKTLNYKTKFIDLAAEVNTSMPEYVVQTLMEGLNMHSKALRNSNILLLGMAYKNDIDDLRESPAFDVFKSLEQRGATVAYHDPYCPRFAWNGAYVESLPLDKELLKSMDAVVITTAHKSIDYQFIVDNSQLIIDSRNATKGLRNIEGKVLRMGGGRTLDE